MQVTIRPLQILSRVVAVCIVALPLAAVHMLVDDLEREAVGKLSHADLIKFVTDAHASGVASAYFLAAGQTLIIVIAVEVIAFGFRCFVGLFGANEPESGHRGEYTSARTDSRY